MKLFGKYNVGARWMAVAAIGWGCLVGAAESVAPQMTVLQFKVTPGGLSLVGATNVVGRCKPQPAESVGIEYQVRSVDSVVLSSGTVKNPLVQRTCFEEVPGSGELTTKYVELPEAELVVRIPADEAASSIRFYEHAPATGRAANAAPRLLGEISLK